ncbi:MAG: hypothetical protein KGZ25_12765, partial [Planctomycetes bacterium]|nr:hypothetical protein [Planctomycetota bacterium]
MRKVLMILALTALAVPALAGGEITREEFDKLKKRVYDQSEVIGNLRGRIAVLEKKIDKLEEAQTAAETAEKTDDAAETKEQDSRGVKKLQQIPAHPGTWTEWHYVGYSWRKRKWSVKRTGDKKSGAIRLEGADRAKRSRILHNATLKGDFVVRLALKASGDSVVELAQGKSAAKLKKGFRLSLPRKKLAYVEIRRQDGELSARINGEEAEVTAKNYKGKKT